MQSVSILLYEKVNLKGGRIKGGSQYRISCTLQKKSCLTVPQRRLIELLALAFGSLHREYSSSPQDNSQVISSQKQ